MYTLNRHISHVSHIDIYPLVGYTQSGLHDMIMRRLELSDPLNVQISVAGRQQRFPQYFHVHGYL
jgi:hypothetical protein